MNFEDFVQRFDAGNIGTSDIEQLLTIIYGDEDTPEKIDRRARVIRDGQVVKFQAVGLNRQAQEQDVRARVAANQPPSAPEPLDGLDGFENDIPEPIYERPDLIPQIKSRVGIIQAVRTWGKPQARIKDGRSEGVKVRCPYSHHTDNDPSAWVNSEKNTWYCGKCMIGGDVIDFYAAVKHDLEPDSFHRSREFSRIIEEMADELGISIVSTPEGGFVVETESSTWASNLPDPAEPEVERPWDVTSVTEETPEGPVTQEYAYQPAVPSSTEAEEPITISEEEVLRGISVGPMVDPDGLFSREVRTFDWRELDIPKDTFLSQWMLQAELELEWIPPEFFLGLGLQAIGMACGQNTTSRSFGLPLTGQTMYVFVGGTASGKSTATNRLRALIEGAAGCKFDRALGSGVKVITSSASAESLTARMRTEIIDAHDPQNPVEVPTNGWYIEDELAQFISRSRRQGGEHIKQRVMRFHDFAKRRDEPEIAVEDHSMTGGYRVVHDSYFTATFLTQNESLRDLATRSDLVSGFFNRMTFIMGLSRADRTFCKVVSEDPDPRYRERYERLWKDCNMKKRVIPFSDAAGARIDSHELNPAMRATQELSPMFSRWQMMMLRTAMLLAVNENRQEIGVDHVDKAYRLVSEFFIPCAGSVAGHVADDSKEQLMSRFENYVTSYFDKSNQWPEKRGLTGHRSWKSADPEIRQRSLNLCFMEKSLVEVILIEGPWGKGQRSVLLTPTGDFLPFEDANGKKFKYQEFYGGRRVR